MHAAVSLILSFFLRSKKLIKNMISHEANMVGDMKISCGSWYEPNRSAKYPGGQDHCHFYSDERKIFGIADGVGGYSRRGIDSGIYAREFMCNTVDAIDELCKPGNSIGNSTYNIPLKAMKKAFQKTAASGACTACIISLEGRQICAANIGDSSFVVVRSGKVIYHSPEQCHSFNCPFQLGRTAENPSHAQTIYFKDIQPGDMIVAGTDGVFDNLFDGEVALSVMQAQKYQLGPQLTAQLIAYMALWVSNHSTCKTPFMLKSIEAGRGHRPGGKRDDITVVVADVQASSAGEEKSSEAMNDELSWRDKVVWLLVNIETKILIQNMKMRR